MNSDEQNSINELQARYNAVSLIPDDFMPDILYHYTSAVGFLGIVSSGVLRAGNFSYLNDSSEIQFGRKIAHSVIDEYIQSVDNLAHQKVLVRAQRTINDTVPGLEFYLLCFCTKPDRLSQWRAYGSIKGRFCIGFDTEALPASGLQYSLSRVIYDPTEQKRKVNRAIENAIEVLAKGSSPEFVETVHDLLARKVTREIAFFKDKGFEEEDEWRAVYTHEPADAIEFDASSGIIKPFVELWTSKSTPECRLPIAQVIVGPSLFPSLSKKSAELLLARHGYQEVKISEFGVPFRDL